MRWSRRAADALVRHAVLVMPDPLAHWAEGMASECAHVDDDRAALRWAVGCVRVAHLARLRNLHLLDNTPIRAAGVLLALFSAFGAMFPSIITLAYRMRSGMLEGLGRMTPGDDYRRLVPLMNAIPDWLHVLTLAAGACYVVAALCLLRRRRSAYVALLLAVALELSAERLTRPIAASVNVVVVADPSLLSAVLLPVVLPLLLAFASWSGTRRDASV
jgi:hypothetical protein